MSKIGDETQCVETREGKHSCYEFNYFETNKKRILIQKPVKINVPGSTSYILPIFFSNKEEEMSIHMIYK